MTQLEFFEMFSAEESELLCSRIEFLDAVTADPFDAEKAVAVANRILNFNSHETLAAAKLAACWRLTSNLVGNRAQP
jgi:hypothetical protein